MASPMTATVPARTGREITPTKPPLWFGPHAVYKFCGCSISEPKCALMWRLGRKRLQPRYCDRLRRLRETGSAGVWRGNVNVTDLPQLRGRPMVTDGGMETDLIFHHGLHLPLFAAFPL